MTISRRSGFLAALGTLGAALAGCTTAGTTPIAAPSTGASPAPSDAVGGGPSLGPSPADPTTASPTPTPTPTPTAPALPWAGVADPLPSGPVNVLIVGTDNNTDVGNTDVLVVAQLSADRSRVTLVGIPRDSYVSIASGGRDKINSALYRGGISNTKATVQNLFGGLKIHYVAQTNFRDFIRLCVLFNGFAVVNRVASSVTSSVTGRVSRFPRGKLQLWGADWLIYARQRKGLPNGEFDRGERHRAIITGMTHAAKWLYTRDPDRLVRIARGVFDHVNIYGGLNRDNILGLLPHLETIYYANFTSVKVPHAAVGDSVTLAYGALGDLARGLRNGDITPYLRAYGLTG